MTVQAEDHVTRLVRMDGGGFIVYCDGCGCYLDRATTYPGAYTAARRHEEEVQREQDEAGGPAA